MAILKWFAVSALGLIAFFIAVTALLPKGGVGTDEAAMRVAARDLARCARDKVQSACIAHIVDCAKNDSTCVNEEERALGVDMREYLDAQLHCARGDQAACARAEKMKRDKFPQ